MKKLRLIGSARAKILTCRLLAGRNPDTGRPFEDITVVFDLFLARSVPEDPEDDEFFITISVGLA